MKKITFRILLAMMPFISQAVLGQDTLAMWTFPGNVITDTIQNGPNSLNAGAVIRAVGTAAVSMKNGNGAGNYALQATGWDNGMDTKYWQLAFKTTGYNMITVSSKQTSGSANPGPKDFKLQYKVDVAGTWTDVTGATSIVLANDWVTGVVNNVSLPVECEDQSVDVYLRWIMTSNNDIATVPAPVLSSGTSKIDDIIIKGVLGTGIKENTNREKVSINYISSNSIKLISSSRMDKLSVWNISGQEVLSLNPESNQVLLNTSTMITGIYFIRVILENNEQLVKKILVQ